MTGSISIRKDNAQYAVSEGPDVCLTPMGSAMVPVAYITIGLFGMAIRTVDTVRLNGKPAFNTNSRLPKTQGTEPGTGRGLAQSGHIGPARIPKGAASVHMGGAESTRDNDGAELNMAGM